MENICLTLDFSRYPFKNYVKTAEESGSRKLCRKVLENLAGFLDFKTAHHKPLREAENTRMIFIRKKKRKRRKEGRKEGGREGRRGKRNGGRKEPESGSG